MNPRRAVSTATLLLLISSLGCGDDDPASVPTEQFSDRFESTFAVGETSVLEISNFAGAVEVVTGAAGMVHVVVEKWAARSNDLDQIDVEMSESSNVVHITTEAAHLQNVSVDLEVTVPPGARPVLQSGAGAIAYEGRPQGECRFATGAGSIALKLPADINVEVYLAVGAGTVYVDFPVAGQVGDRIVDGVIGTGAEGRIEATVGAGRIAVSPQ